MSSLDLVVRPVHYPEVAAKKGAQTKARIVARSSRLIEAQGFTATGLKQILEVSEVPRGSFYFHFPDGKEGLALAVVEAHARTFAGQLETFIRDAPTAVAAGRALVDHLATRVQTKGPQAGCPVMAITLEIGNHAPEVRDAVREAFEAWAATLAVKLFEDGVDNEVAEVRARAALAAVQGALVLCRAYGDPRPLEDVAASLPQLLAP